MIMIMIMIMIIIDFNELITYFLYFLNCPV
jgi:hypothetical protein